LKSPLKQEWTVYRFAVVVSLLWATACGGDDGGEPDAASALDGAPPGDAFLGDAAVVDCSGDHRESADSSNDPFSDGKNGSPERTNLSLGASGRGFTVCGQLDPAEATGQVTDYDSYVFEVDGPAQVNLRIELRATAEAGQIGLDLFRVEDGLPVPVATGPFLNGYALVAGVVVAPGSYWVSAVGWPPATDGPIGYAISVAENLDSCPPAEGMPDYSEAADADSRGNDTVAIDYPAPPRVTEADDQPEPTALVLTAGTVALVHGQSGAVESAGDSYLDRDAYEIETGPDTSELELRLAWEDGDVDLDVYLFEAGDPGNDYSVGLGTSIGGSGDELLTVNVDPEQRYWLWVGAFDSTAQGGGTDLPRDYDVTLCPRQHAPSL